MTNNKNDLKPNVKIDSDELFESRKRDHIRLALEDATQSKEMAQFDHYRLVHEAFPELDFEEIDISQKVFGKNLKSPMFVSSMTAGHRGSQGLNLVMAKVCENRNWAMGVGSQRRELYDNAAAQEWREIRKQCPKVVFFGNIGVAQLIQTPTKDIARLVESLEATAIFVHTNPVQECFQPEGTPQFKGGLKAIERLARELEVPVIVKETGSGFAQKTLEKLRGTGISAVDVAGLGGTHWGRIEGFRSQTGDKNYEAAQTFRNWGVSTIDSVRYGVQMQRDFAIWASGGVRSGKDAALLVAMGAEMVGFAQPIIRAALQGEDALSRVMDLFEFEMRTAMFCTGCKNIKELQESKVWEQI